MFLQVFDSSKFNRVLLWVIRFCVLVLDVHVLLDPQHILTPFFLGIITSEGRWAALFSNEITVNFREIMLMFHTIHIDDMGTKAKEDLSTGEAMKDTLDICE